MSFTNRRTVRIDQLSSPPKLHWVDSYDACIPLTRDDLREIRRESYAQAIVDRHRAERQRWSWLYLGLVAGFAVGFVVGVVVAR